MRLDHADEHDEPRVGIVAVESHGGEAARGAEEVVRLPVKGVMVFPGDFFKILRARLLRHIGLSHGYMDPERGDEHRVFGAGFKEPAGHQVQEV